MAEGRSPRGRAQARAALGAAAAKQVVPVQIVVSPSVKAETVHAALDRLFREHGCTTCGLVGIDLRFRVIDEAVSKSVAAGEGVQGVIVGGGS